MNEQPRWLEDDEQELWQLILAATRKLDRGMENTLQAGGELSMPEFAVLATLSDAQDTQMRLRELCNYLEWDRSRRSEEHTSELQSRFDLVCRLLLEKKKKDDNNRL